MLFSGLLSVFMVQGQTNINKPGDHVPWSRNAAIYEVNIRQFTPEGNFAGLEKELPRLQKMGVEILWLMPINPLGVKNRKGTLGSYYSVSDYFAVNPEYGTKKEFVALVNRAHELGMKVIVDWVANHTSWDNTLITQHPDWYKKDSTGKIIPPVADWTDVAALDYSKKGVRQFMSSALLSWIQVAGIDGYRCDVAGMVPVSFWNEIIPKLRKVKPIFMLAEEEKPVMHDTGCFDATYSWGLFHLMDKIAQKRSDARKIDSLLDAEKRSYPKDSYRMRFTSNHDENSWNGTEYERLGDGAKCFAVLTYTIPGIPLMYSGQESAMNKRLRFFDKDTIPWGSYPLAKFYTTLNQLKKDNNLIASGDSGGEFVKVGTNNDKAVYAFLRKKDAKQLLVILNLSETPQVVSLAGNAYIGSYTELFKGDKKTFKAGEVIKLAPWEYLIYQ